MKTEFSNEQFESAYPDGIEHHWWLLARSRIVANMVKANTRPGSAVLEVGCGRGIVVKSLREAGIDCAGVELAEVKPIYAAERYVFSGTDAIELSDLERQRYETILLLDVIEHIAKPVDFLQNLAEAFPNLSCVIVTVPACPELWSNYDEFYGHYRRYTPAMLSQLSRQLCWKLTQTSYFFHLVYLPAWLISQLKRKRETRLVAPTASARLLHRVVSWVMSADYYLLPRRLVGTSAIACFRL